MVALHAQRVLAAEGRHGVHDLRLPSDGRNLGADEQTLGVERSFVVAEDLSGHESCEIVHGSVGELRRAGRGVGALDHGLRLAYVVRAEIGHSSTIRLLSPCGKYDERLIAANA